MGQGFARLMGALAKGALLIVLATVGCVSTPPEPERVADPGSARGTAQGTVIGSRSESGGLSWLGIPFAQPPLGALRWKAPRPPSPRAEPLEALDFGPECVQFAGPAGSDAGSVVGSEDCLYLNVFAPATAQPGSEPGLPVMVWIHGGGNSVGSAHVYDSSRLAAQENVIVVTIHYRLGVLGWFSHPALRTPGASPSDGSGNYAVLDMVRALEWVRSEIAGFGGDPRRVTIFGESAGGTNVFALLLSPPARGLFHRAISQSGSLSSVPRAEAEGIRENVEGAHVNSSGEVLLDLLVADGSADDRASARTKRASLSPAEVGDYLRGKTPGELMAVFDGANFGGMYWIPQLIRDGAVIPLGEPLDVIRAGEFARVPVIFGTNRDEVKLFAMMGSEHVTRFFGIPVWLNDERAYTLETEYPSQMWKVRGADDPARAVVSREPGRVFVYRFDWDEERKLLFADLSTLVGAGHAVEIPFVFGNLDLGGLGEYIFDPERRPAADALSVAMMGYWGEFARTGNPGRATGGDLPLWLPWDASSADGVRMLILDTPADGGLRMSSQSLTREGVLAQIAEDPRFEDLAERCAVYRSLAERGDALSPAEYTAILGGACAAYPLAEFGRD
ncbi:MAG: carboxylesterase family protein [Myxococcota bacterium]|nr:carboxylesterase family protein [Myxococcota bacterium]